MFLTMVYLRRLDEEMDRLALAVAVAVADIGRRVMSLEAKVALIDGDLAAQSERIDRMEMRLERVERRLDIVDA